MSNNTLHIQVLDDTIRALYNERKNYAGDSGFDLYCPGYIVIPAQTYATVDLRVKCAPQFTPQSGYYLYPRSSISKTPLIMANSVGIIDSGYRGNIMARVYNTSDNIYIINQGDRLFQLCHPSLQPLNVVFVDSLDSTERNSGGFGSTGR